MIDIAIKAALEASVEMLKIYEQDFEVFEKSDESPLTLADKIGHEIIEKHLKQTNLPILSEEGKHLAFEDRKHWDLFWMVDPLDGTKEFIKKNGEFTVNIALIKGDTPVMGVVYSPVLKFLYVAYKDNQAYKIQISPEDIFSSELLNEEHKIPRDLPKVFTIVGSKSHHSSETESFVNEMKVKHGEVDFVSMGSSLKLCLVAEGKAHVYPRLAPTMEWDTAAGDAVCRAAGKEVIAFETSLPLKYNKENLLNPFFVVQ
jgi:3'(2'), 5'-bisphosphate nucleotidase